MWALSNRWSQIKLWLVCKMKFMFAPSAPLPSWRTQHIPGCVLPEGNSLHGNAIAVAYKWTFIKSICYILFAYSPLSSPRYEAEAEAATQQLIIENLNCVRWSKFNWQNVSDTFKWRVINHAHWWIRRSPNSSQKHVLFESVADLFKPHNDDEAAKLMTISLLLWKVFPLIVVQWCRLST